MRTAVIISLLAAAQPVIADERAERRASCTPMVTAIYEGCEITNHFSCPDGSVYAEELRASGGMIISLFDDAYNMQYAHNPDTGDPPLVDLIRRREPFGEHTRKYQILLGAVCRR